MVKAIGQNIKTVSKKILLNGEILFDIFDMIPYIGGGSTNTCSHLSKLGAQCALISAVGYDELGDRSISILNGYGADTRYIGRNEHPTGTVNVKIDSRGMPRYNILKEVAYDYIVLAQEEMQTIRETGYDAFFFGTMHQRGNVSRDTIKQVIESIPFAIRFLDINLREGCYTRESVLYSLQKCTILKLNQYELKKLQTMLGLSVTDPVHDLLHNYPDINILLVTRGADGVSAYTKNSKQDIEGIPVQVVDTVGSGDAFSAAFLHVYLNTGNIISALKAGNILGAYVASCRGAVPDYTDDLKKQIALACSAEEDMFSG